MKVTDEGLTVPPAPPPVSVKVVEYPCLEACDCVAVLILSRDGYAEGCSGSLSTTNGAEGELV